MGQFSWMYSDTGEQMLDNKQVDSYLLVPPPFQKQYGQFIYEGNYNGYGRMGGYDVYDLIAEWNREFLSPDMLEPAPKLDNFGGLWSFERAELVSKGIPEEEIERLDAEQRQKQYNNAISYYEQRCRMLSEYRDGKEDKAMERDYGEDWKREIGINIACYDRQNMNLPFPIKITSIPMDYEVAEPSKRDPNQGWETEKEHIVTQRADERLVRYRAVLENASTDDIKRAALRTIKKDSCPMVRSLYQEYTEKYPELVQEPKKEQEKEMKPEQNTLEKKKGIKKALNM